MRVKRGTKARRRHKRALKHAEGYYGARSRTYADAVEQVHASWQYQYAHRKLRKREFRRLWIARIGAAARAAGTSYSRLMHALREKGVDLDRKLLADLAVRDPGAFQAVVDSTRK
jgi:large subunit ribosomal protein L20